MPDTTCHTCGQDFNWTWEEAFNKFGFGDGDFEVMTDDVARVLENAGYAVRSERFGLHNTVITSIIKDGTEIIAEDRVTAGYDDPRIYLPDDIVQLLDTKLPANGEVVS